MLNRLLVVVGVVVDLEEVGRRRREGGAVGGGEGGNVSDASERVVDFYRDSRSLPRSN